jgi:hypothetical protein
MGTEVLGFGGEGMTAEDARGMMESWKRSSAASR